MEARTRTARGVATAVLGVTLIAMAAVATAAAAPTGATRALTCDAIAKVPYVDAATRTGGAQGGAYNNCPYFQGWSYTLRFVNRAGNTLIQSQGAANGNTIIIGPSTSCAGAYVHSFVYINVSGAGKSDTSGENLNCAY